MFSLTFLLHPHPHAHAHALCFLFRFVFRVLFPHSRPPVPDICRLYCCCSCCSCSCCSCSSSFLLLLSAAARCNERLNMHADETSAGVRDFGQCLLSRALAGLAAHPLRQPQRATICRFVPSRRLRAGRGRPREAACSTSEYGVFGSRGRFSDALVLSIKKRDPYLSKGARKKIDTTPPHLFF